MEPAWWETLQGVDVAAFVSTAVRTTNMNSQRLTLKKTCRRDCLAYEAFTTETPDVQEDEGDHQSNRPRKKRKIQRKVPTARAKQWG
jgi:hypothetical protein